MSGPYYAYLHIRPDKTGVDSIFYVGKGDERRVKKLARCNKHHTACLLYTSPSPRD